MFDFLGGNFFDVTAGESALEPIQLAVRSVIERAVVEMMANLYGMPGPDSLPARSDPLGGDRTGVTGGLLRPPTTTWDRTMRRPAKTLLAGTLVVPLASRCLRDRY